MPTNGFFDFIHKILELSEHFALLSHWVDPGMSREVIGKRDIILASAECGYPCRSPYIRVDYLHDSFAHIPLYREWMLALFPELACLTYAKALSFH